MKTYYDVMGVSKESDFKTIKSAYRKLVKKFHPDTIQRKSGSTLKIFEEITGAYSTLINPEKRKEYDNSLLKRKENRNNFKFRELKDWLFSKPFLQTLFAFKKISRKTSRLDPSLLAMSVDDLLKRIIYSKNTHVQIHSVRLILAKKKHYAVNDLLRLLYSNIDENVKIEIIEGLKVIAASKIKQVIYEIYDIEKSYES